uniref:Stress-activated protein kinase JNK n=1 Tax=Panagrolaimus sp. ES5 TaxID=591445 RepID=A0AC34FF35_9BILA
MNMYKTDYDGTEFHIPNRYVALDYQGTVGNGIIISASDSKTQQPVATKKFTRPFADSVLARRTYREFVILNLINHRNVVKLLNTYTPQNNVNVFCDVYHVMEGNLRAIELQNHLHKPLSYLMYQILCGINHLHKSGIIHRNLTPDSLGFTSDAVVKIRDFGMACPENCSRLTAYVSQRYYRAPEIILGIGYKANADVWALGCIFVELLTRKILFPGKTCIDQWIQIISFVGTPNSAFPQRLENSVKEYIKSLQYFPTQSWEKVLPDSLFTPEKSDVPELEKAVLFRDLISRMLIIDPIQRISIQEALDHPYVKMWYDSSQVDGPASLPYKIQIDETEHDVKTWKSKFKKNFSFKIA